MEIAIAGAGYVGLSLAVLLAKHNEVHALDEKVEKLRNYVSPNATRRSSGSWPMPRPGSVR